MCTNTIVAAIVGALFFLSCSGDSGDLYVSLDGKVGNQGGIDDPFVSIEEAQKSVRDLIAQDAVPSGGLTINIRGGIYSIDHSLEFAALDGGSSDRPIIWQAYEGEEVSLTGGKEISSFSTVIDEDVLKRLPEVGKGKILQIDLGEEGINDFGALKRTGFGGEIQPTALELFFKGKPMTLARYPNEGWETIQDVPQTGDLKYKGDVANPGAWFDGIPGGRHYGRFSYEGERPSRWSHIEDVWMHGYWVWDWADMYEQIDSIDVETNEIHPTVPYHHYGYRKGQRYYYLNILEELDQPGEWYLDRKTGLLYFWPPEDIAEGDVLVSVLEDPILKIRNTSYLEFRKLIIEAGRGSGIDLAGGDHVHLMGCTIRNLGNYGVYIEGGTNHLVQSCDIYQVGDGGVHVDGGVRKKLTPGNHKVVNCDIHHYSRVNRTGRPAVTLLGVGNTLSHNHIHDAPHVGVWFGGNGHLLEYNDVHDLAKETGDVGAFYIGRDWTCRDNVIRYNYFHQLFGPGLHGVMAVYLDDFSSGTTIFGNVFYQSGRSAFVGGGRDNTIDNNLFIECAPSVHVDARGIGWASYCFDRDNPHFNSVMFDRMDSMNYSKPPFSVKYPELLTLYEDDPSVPKGNQIVNNVSVGGRWLDLYNGVDFSTVNIQNNFVADSLILKWTKVNGGPTNTYTQSDQEINSRFETNGNKVFSGDIKVRDLKSGIPNLDPSSPAFGLGFKPIPYDEIGLVKDEFRTKIR